MFFTNKLLATHVPGGNITYENISPNTFVMTLTVYEDCGGSVTIANGTQSISASNTCGLTSPTITLPNIIFQNEASQLCSQLLGQSECNGGTFPGIYMHVWSDTITLPGGCDSWLFSWDLCCRNTSINANGSSNDFYIETILNSVTAPTNSSPVFTSQPIPYNCLNQLVNYSFGVVEPDGDSLHYSLVSAMTDAGVFLPYNPVYSGSSPINGIAIDPITGEITFIPTIQGNFVVAVLIEEFNSNGDLVGSVMQDFQFEILVCQNIGPSPPAGGIVNLYGADTLPGSLGFGIQACEGDSICFDMVFTDSNPNDTLSITSNITQLFPGSTFSQTGSTSPVTASFCMAVLPGTNPFTAINVSVTDNSCPINGKSSFAIGLSVVSSTNCSPPLAQTYVPDDNFEAYLEANGMGDGIASNDSVLTASISGVTNLSVPSLSIADLTGIEDFIALNTFDCQSNQLTNLDISNNTALVTFYCLSNQLTSLDVSNNTVLNTLGCQSNQLTSLDVSNNTALIGLNIQNNQIVNLDVSNNTALKLLYCNSNQLTSLDLSNNTLLNQLQCQNNQLTSLDLRNGNNINFTYIVSYDFNVIGNANLNCISVDDATWATANWTGIDSHTSFSNDCALFSSLTADFSASDSTFCQGTTVTFTDLSTGTPTSWAWDFGDGTTSNLQNPTHTYAASGAYDVSLTVTTSSGSDSETKTSFITVNSNPNINAGIDQTICSGDSVTLNATSGQNFIVGVTAVNASNYILSGAFAGNDPAINVSLGDTLTFNVNSPGHPFLIKTTATTGTANSVAVSNNGTSSGIISWAPSSAGTYYYICEFHAGMVGTITVGGNNINYTWDNSVINGVAFTPTATNTYTVTTADGNGCFSTDNVTVNLIPNSTGVDVISSCDSITWIDGVTYTASNNSATFTLQTANGCDSVVTLNLTINQTLSGTDVISSCDSITWIDGITYSTSNNTANYTLTNAAGCDSVVTLNLTINQNLSGTDVISSCDSITWIDGITYTASNSSATFTLQTANGCDSIVTLNLTINQGSTGTDVISACDSITWIDGITYTASNNSATFTLLSANGCDSVVTLNLTINQNLSGTDVISACDSITWINGITYTASNNSATFTIQTANGCDSIVTLNLTINQGSTGTDVISACDSITWIDGITYSTSNNIANYTFSNAAGCDSIVTLNLTISSGFLSEETLSACDSLLWSVNGNTYTQSGIYYDSLQSSNGCDSLYKLDLIVNSSSSSLFITSSCLSYSWNGQTLLATGIYIDTNVNAAGCLQYDSLDLTITTIPNVFNEVACDSFAWNGTSYNTSGTYTTSGACVDTLNLTINNSSTSISSLSSCDSANWNGLTYSVTGIYNFITTNSVGCDSTATLNLNIDSGSVSQLSITACNSYLWNGVSYNQSGTYYDSLQNTTGCDSTLVLNLTVDSSTTTTLSEVACNTYFWNNNSYTSSGNYRDTLQNINGCDSVVTLNLTINNSSSSLINITACDSYSWNGTSYNVTGIYYDSLQTASGCDSIQTLNLTINNSINNTINISACDTYSWNGVSYNVSGTYTYGSLTASGCDSIVTLNLTINNSYSSTDTINSCNSYSWNGTTYNQSGTYYDSSSTVNGCDSINILSLIISGNIFSLDTAAACQSYIWNGNQYDSSGIYIDTITSLVGCDSIKTLYLTINDDVTSPITLELLLDDYCLETYWNVKDSQDSVWYSGQNYNCNPSGGGTQANIIINKKMYLDPNDCYTFELGDVYGDGLGASFWGGVDGSWLIKDFNNLVIGQGQGDFGFIVEYSFLVGQSFVTNVIENEDLKPVISIYPNPTNENITISIENFNGNIQTEVYDLIGHRLQNTNKTTINLRDYARGIYLLKVAYGDRVEEVKVIKE